MRKRILFAMLLATTSLLVACGSNSTQDTQEVQDIQETTSQEVETPQEEVVQEELPLEEVAIKEETNITTDTYINMEKREEPFYKSNFILTNFLMGEQFEGVEEGVQLHTFEEYSQTNTRYILVNYINANGTSGAIRVPHIRWNFDNIKMSNNEIEYHPEFNDKQITMDNYSEYIPIFYFGVFEISMDQNDLVKDCISENRISDITSQFPLVRSSYPNNHLYEYNGTKERAYEIEEGENYSKIVYETPYDFVVSENYQGPYGSGKLTELAKGATCIYDDYENMKRYIIVRGSTSSIDIEDVMEIEILDNELHFNGPTSSWIFPEGMEGKTQKTPMVNDMSKNVTTYTTPNNHEMSFHWYGPRMLASQASEEKGVLTLEESEGLYKLNAQAIPIDEVWNMYDIGSYGLMDNEHYVEGSNIDDYGTQILYPIVDDNGYKGYATLLYGSNNQMPQDYYYFFTYVEKEDVYDDERALEVMASLDYHFEEDN